MQTIAIAVLSLSGGPFQSTDVAKIVNDEPRSVAQHLRGMIKSGILRYVKTKPAIYQVNNVQLLMQMARGKVEPVPIKGTATLAELLGYRMPAGGCLKGRAVSERHNPDAQGVLQLPRRGVCLETYV